MEELDDLLLRLLWKKGNSSKTLRGETSSVFCHEMLLYFNYVTSGAQIRRSQDMKTWSSSYSSATTVRTVCLEMSTCLLITLPRMATVEQVKNKRNAVRNEEKLPRDVLWGCRGLASTAIFTTFGYHSKLTLDIDWHIQNERQSSPRTRKTLGDQNVCSCDER